MSKHDVLRAASFGQRVAEDEIDFLATYFVETDDWQQLFDGRIDVVYGPKGAGKSALYHLLSSRKEDLRQRGILLVTAENPRGATAFKNLIADPPASEREFVGMWKLYFACLLQAALTDEGLRNASYDELTDVLADAGLVRGGASLSRLFAAVLSYAKRFANVKEVEGGVELDPLTQMPNGVKGKIVFAEPEGLGGKQQVTSVDQLLELANEALTEANTSVWILLDRLDVAFSEHEQLEINALRALFRVYLDLLAFKQIQLKVFLRTDIWSRITEGGFREASHITRHLTINWNRASLLNLVVKRLLHNESIRQYYKVTEELSRRPLNEQEAFYFELFPQQVDVGPNKPLSFDWMLSRTRDGGKANAPRELIHLLNSLRDTQVRRFEMGEQPDPEGNHLFARAAFKAALPEVSKVRLEQTIYAEYPSQKDVLERLRGEKTSHTVDTLSNIWGVDRATAAKMADSLASIGFFEMRGEKAAPEFWVPFLYRDALDLVQGGAE
ncbi:P-loop ATPase, Sll1717 family [Cupriavidus gilardii]|uniref:P-loop ATPase, Sll1717 family n=1 Tax=Cupriavidus gilardii TaxID=82541 RepID=UPI0007E33A9B|nr:hypothetical protein [Cupriavidus gilardii]